MNSIRRPLSSYSWKSIRSLENKYGSQKIVRKKDRDRGVQRSREGPRNPKFSKYTPLNTGRARILEEALSVELIPAPWKFPSSPNVNRSRHCRYHRNYSHTTKESMALKEKIEELSQAGHLQRNATLPRTNNVSRTYMFAREKEAL